MIPKEAIEKLPWGYEAFEGGKGKYFDDMYWFGPHGWTTEFSRHCGLTSMHDVYALPVVPPAGMRLVKNGESRKSATMYRGKRGGEWRSYDTPLDHECNDSDSCYYACRIEPAKEPAKDEAKCPACGGAVAVLIDRVACSNMDCQLYSYMFTPAFIKRITVAPEPLTCPYCKGPAEYIPVGRWVRCIGDCEMVGPTCADKEAAIKAWKMLKV